MKIPEFRVNRYMQVNFKETKFGGNIMVDGIDVNGDPYTIFNAKKAEYNPKEKTQKIQLTFQGHYNENDLIVEVPNDLLKEKNLRIKMVCDPHQFGKNNGLRFGLWERAEAVIGGKVFPLKITSFDPKAKTTSNNLSVNSIAQKKASSINRKSSFNSASTKSSANSNAKASTNTKATPKIKVNLQFPVISTPPKNNRGKS